MIHTVHVHAFHAISFIAIFLCFFSTVLNYIRALRFISYTDALVYLGILKTGLQIRLSQLILTFLGVWFAGSGIMFVVSFEGKY